MFKYYTIKVKEPEHWQEFHDILCDESNVEHIPNRPVACVDEKLHSPTRGTFELTEEESESLKNHPHIEWVELSSEHYSELYPKPQLTIKRFNNDVKIYRTVTANTAPVGGPPSFGTPTSVEANRTNWGIRRVGILTAGDFWTNETGSDLTVKTGDINYNLTGKNVDIVVQDSGVLQYHPEFLNSNGQSRVRDVVLDGPYYIDPDYFNNIIPGVKYTKADGRVGIATTSARDWWINSDKRSSQFSGIGTISSLALTALYTADKTVGIALSGISSISNSHGTGCASVAAGKNFGLAFEANIWNLTCVDGAVPLTVAPTGYDIVKLFHTYKPINSETGVKNPTLVNGSWGFTAAYPSVGIVTCKFRGSISTFTASDPSTTQVTAMKNGLIGRTFITSSRNSSSDQSGNELINSGVIYVAAAGNQNQRICSGLNDPDLYNYMVIGGPLSDPRTDYFPSTGLPCNHRNWLNPTGIGYNSSTDFHPVICVGAIESTINSDYSERKASYSNNGSGIDIWAPTDLFAASIGSNVYRRYDDTRFFDQIFNGTSCAAPFVTGLIALYLQANPKATSIDVKRWLKTRGSVVVNNSLLQDEYSNDTTVGFWTGSYNMRGAEKRFVFNPFDNDKNLSIKGVRISGINFKQL